MIDYALVLAEYYADENWLVAGFDYAGIQWNSKSPIPSQSELDSLWVELVAKWDSEKQSAIDSRNSAIAKLKKLGLTDDEIAAFLT